jgi:hypothetical protein
MDESCHRRDRGRPRHTEISELLARKICRGLSVPEIGPVSLPDKPHERAGAKPSRPAEHASACRPDAAESPRYFHLARPAWTPCAIWSDAAAGEFRRREGPREAITRLDPSD